MELNREVPTLFYVECWSRFTRLQTLEIPARKIHKDTKWNATLFFKLVYYMFNKFIQALSKPLYVYGSMAVLSIHYGLCRARFQMNTKKALVEMQRRPEDIGITFSVPLRLFKPMTTPYPLRHQCQAKLELFKGNCLSLYNVYPSTINEKMTIWWTKSNRKLWQRQY